MRFPFKLKNKNILIVGAGGGFDIYAGLPLYHQLIEQNNNVYLANYSDKYDVLGRLALATDYPEGQLGIPCFLLPRGGVQLVRKVLDNIVASKMINQIILVDGGVDSLMTGDEKNQGTTLEDFITLTATAKLQCPSMLACFGFGTEQDENLDHNAVLENMAKLADSFIGVCAVTKNSEGFKFYKTTLENAWQHGRKSHIHSKIIPAVEGVFGELPVDGVDARLGSGTKKSPFIHPLMSLYWFYDLQGVIVNNKLSKILEKSNNLTDAQILLRQIEESTRVGTKIPL